MQNSLAATAERRQKTVIIRDMSPKAALPLANRPAILQRTKALSSDNASRNSSFAAFSAAGAKAKMAFIFCRTRRPFFEDSFVKYLFPGEKAGLRIRQGRNKNAGKARAAIASISLIQKDVGKRRASAAQLVKKALGKLVDGRAISSAGYHGSN